MCATVEHFRGLHDGNRISISFILVNLIKIIYVMSDDNTFYYIFNLYMDVCMCICMRMCMCMCIVSLDLPSL